MTRDESRRSRGAIEGPDPRRTAVTLMVVVAVLLVGGSAYYRTQKANLLREAEADLVTIGRLKVDQIVAWRAERLGDAAVLMEDRFLSDVAAAWLATSGADDGSRLRSRLRSLSEHYNYQDIVLVDTNGRVRLNANVHPAPLDGPTFEGLSRAWHEHRPQLVDLHASPPELAPSMEAIAPLFVTAGGRDVPAGAFILGADAKQFLYPLIQLWPRPSASAETLIVRRDGDHVLFLNDVRHQAGTALTLRVPLTQSDLPAVMAVRGQEGIVQGVDYRGVEVLAALSRIPDSPWFMVAKVDLEEALAAWYSRSTLILALMLGLVAAAVAVGGVVWQASRRAHFQELFNAEAALGAVEARHRTTLLSVEESVIVTDARGTVELMNSAAERMTGWTVGEAVGRPVAEILTLVDERTRRMVRDPVERALACESVDEVSDRLLLVSRSERETAIAESCSPIPDARGGLSGFVVVFRDQTEERLARRFTETRLALIEFAAIHTLDELLVRAVDEVAAFSESPIGFLHFVDADQRTLALQCWSTRTVQEFCSAEGAGLHYDVDQAGVWADSIRTMRPVVHNDYASLPHRRGLPEGHAEVVRELVAPVLREDRVVAILGVGNKAVDYTPVDVDIVSYLADVTWQIVEQKRAEETITRMAYHDHLTGLPNRLLFNDRLGLAMSTCHRTGEHLALMMLDLDRFKDVNDTFGHDAGDQLLRAAAERLRSVVRESDTVSRFGGDEFCVLLPGLSSLADAVTAARKIVGGFERGFNLDGIEVPVTTSVGIALYPEHGEDGPSLIRHADRAMYRAKRAGRNTYIVHDDHGINDR